jgi:hypothetical protein
VPVYPKASQTKRNFRSSNFFNAPADRKEFLHMEKKILTPEERIKVSENLATSYRDVYTKKTVKTGKTFE